MTIVLDGQNLTVIKLVQIARDGARVELHPDAGERIKTCRRMLEEKVSAHEIMYGVNTGIGEFSEVVLSDEQVQQFQRYLIYDHAARRLKRVLTIGPGMDINRHAEAGYPKAIEFVQTHGVKIPMSWD